MTVGEIQQKLLEYQKAGKRIFITSSFQTHSIPLLHIIKGSNVPVDFYFINTGFHFAETLVFRDQIANQLNLEVKNIRPLVSKHHQKDNQGQFHFASDPDYCCYLNKTQPMDPLLQEYDVWISGVRADQSEVRKSMQTEQSAPNNTVRFHPILDWSSKDIYNYRKKFNLPEHPLDKQGYQSIGCAPCTHKFDLTDERSARWFGLNKVECGLHTDLIS